MEYFTSQPPPLLTINNLIMPGLLGILAFFVRRWINGTREEIQKKVDRDICDLKHETVSQYFSEIKTDLKEIRDELKEQRDWDGRERRGN